MKKEKEETCKKTEEKKRKRNSITFCIKVITKFQNLPASERAHPPSDTPSLTRHWEAHLFPPRTVRAGYLQGHYG